MATVECMRSVFLEPMTYGEGVTFIACVSCFLRRKSIERLLRTLQNGWGLQNQVQFSFQNWPAGHQLVVLLMHDRQSDSCPCPVCWDSK